VLDLTRLFRSDKNAADYAAGDTIIEVGDVSLEMYVVLEGQVDIIAHDKVLETVNPGGMFGELALIDASPRSASAVARSDCRLVPVDQKRFQFLVQQHPYFSLHVMRVLAERLRRTTDSAT
jgi:CRP-like cAMP-binding protein